MCGCARAFGEQHDTNRQTNGSGKDMEGYVGKLRWWHRELLTGAGESLCPVDAMLRHVATECGDGRKG